MLRDIFSVCIKVWIRSLQGKSTVYGIGSVVRFVALFKGYIAHDLNT